MRNSGLSAIVVEQHPVVALAMSTQALVLEQGIAVHHAPSAALRADPATLERYLGVEGQAGIDPPTQTRNAA